MDICPCLCKGGSVVWTFFKICDLLKKKKTSLKKMYQENVNIYQTKQTVTDLEGSPFHCCFARVGRGGRGRKLIGPGLSRSSRRSPSRAVIPNTAWWSVPKLLHPACLPLPSPRLCVLLLRSQMACQGLQRGETLDSLKRESDNLKKKLEVERGKLTDVERKWLRQNNIFDRARVLPTSFVYLKTN